MSVRLDVRPQADGRLHSAIGAARAGSVQIQDNRPLSLRGVVAGNKHDILVLAGCVSIHFIDKAFIERLCGCQR